MKKLIAAYLDRAAKRAEYVRIRDEIASLPADVAREVGIFPGDAAHIAQRAVWG